jgi:TM2 domain-containing membrane protein YozV
MINILDLIIIGLALFYLLKNAGGLLKTIKNLLIVFLALILVGIISAYLLEFPLAKPAYELLRDSYFIKLSHLLIKIIYPAIEKEVPKVDVFIKEKIITPPTPEVTVPRSLPKVNFPRLK